VDEGVRERKVEERYRQRGRLHNHSFSSALSSTRNDAKHKTALSLRLARARI
jgi:hypothetical protein